MSAQIRPRLVRPVLKSSSQMRTQPVQSGVDKLEGLDKGILYVVQVLARNGVETFESCEGREAMRSTSPRSAFMGIMLRASAH